MALPTRQSGMDIYKGWTVRRLVIAVSHRDDGIPLKVEDTSGVLQKTSSVDPKLPNTDAGQVALQYRPLLPGSFHVALADKP